MQRIGSRRFERWGSRSLVAVVVVVALVAVGIATPLAAGKDDRGKGAAIGAGVGLLTGGTRDAAKGALVGAGAGRADPQATRGHYATSKAAAELIALGAATDGFAVMAIRPHLVWGPGDTQLILMPCGARVSASCCAWIIRAPLSAL